MKFLCAISFIVFLSLSSCEDAFTTIIELDPPKFEPAIVLQSEIANGSDFVIFNVSRNYGVLEDPFNDPDNYLLNDAKLIFSVNGLTYQGVNTIDPPNSFDNFEVSLAQPIKAGDVLLCTVSNPGFKDIIARTQVPEPTIINNVKFVENGGLDQSGDERSKIVIDFDDPPGRNFYMIDVMINDFGPSFRPISISSIDPSVSESHRAFTLLVEDSSFDRKRKLLDVLFFRLEEARALGNIRLSWRTISEEYYKYSKTFLNYQNSKDNPFATPVNVFTNIENGLGIFSAYNEQIIIVE